MDPNQNFQALYAQAVAEERDRWEKAFLPIRLLGPFELKPMSLRHLFYLQGVGNAIACGSSRLYRLAQYDAKAADEMYYQLAQYLWVQLPNWSPGDKPTRRFKRQVWKWIRKAGWQACFTICERHLDLTFEDVHTQKDGGHAKAYSFWLASYIDRLATAYGWSEDTILDLPFARLIQYHRQITLGETTGTVPFVTAGDKVMVEQAKAMNAKAEPRRKENDE